MDSQSVDGTVKNSESSPINKESKYKRTRILHACDVCRSRKLKCNGDKPCERCLKIGIVCEYSPANEKKRKCNSTGSKSTKKPETMNNKAPSNHEISLDARMSKLEGLMTLLINKLSPTSPLKILNEETPITTPSMMTSTNISIDGSSSATKPPPSEPLPKYCGTQSSLSILSPKGMIWLARKARDPSILHQFQTIHKSTRKVYFDHVRKWAEPIDINQIKPFPPKEEVIKLIDVAFSEFSENIYSHSIKEIYDIIDIYYSKDYQLSYSELLSLNSYIAIACLFMLDKSKDFEKYKNLQENHFLNAIFYYHRLTMLNEGIKTIQGMLSLIMYCEFATTPQNNYMIISTAVRYAQDLGLHREESFSGLTEEEIIKRRKVWLHIYICDRDSCLKSGKPPIIHDSDVSCLEYEPSIPEIFNDPKIDITTLSSNYIYTIINMEVCRSYQFLTKLTSVSYTELFSANALKGCSMQNIIYKINKLKKIHQSILDKIPYSLRLGSKNINWKLFDLKTQQEVMTMHLHSLLHKMNITRMAFKRGWLDNENETMSVTINIPDSQRLLMEECLDCARGMLSIFSEMPSYRKSCFNHYVFLFLSAFFTLLSGSLEYPGGLKKPDVLLLKQAVETYYDKLSITSFNDKEIYNTLSYFLRFFVKIAIDIYNISNPSDKIDRTPLDKEMRLFEKVLSIEEIKQIPYDPVRHQEILPNLYQIPSNFINPNNSSVNTPTIFDDLQFLNDFQSNFSTNNQLNNNIINNNNTNNNNPDNNFFQQIFSIPNLYLNFDDVILNP